MKRLSTFVFALLLAGSLSFAQTGTGTGTGTTKAADAPKTDDSGKKAHKGGKKAHKGGKKSKKGSTDAGAATPPPK